MPLPDALLLISPGCAHCPTMAESLLKLVKEGLLARLEIVNLEERPDMASQLGVRSVPWCRLGEFELQGAQAYDSLRKLAELIPMNGGHSAYLLYLLEQRQLIEATARVRQRPGLLPQIIPLLGDLNTAMSIRIAIGALLEELEDSSTLGAAIAPLQSLLLSTEPQVRADACHYLGLCGDTKSIAELRSMLDDPDHEVREIAAESLALLHDKSQ
jgi:thioredoxin-like negative regulator of GroEL